jgi:hypothetical protein
MPKPQTDAPLSKRERRALAQERRLREERRRARVKLARRTAGIAAAIVVVAVAVLVPLLTRTRTPTDVAAQTLTGPAGPEGIALEEGTPLASLNGDATGQTVDGISCTPGEQIAYHIHAHLTVYVNGVLRPLPAGVGVVSPVASGTGNETLYSASTCYYWLHVHAQDGVIHVESPTTATYTLGQFFAIWGEPLTSTQVASASGSVTAYVNGVRYTGDPSAITLRSHEDIQIDVGTPAPGPKHVDWSGSGL